LGRFGTFDEKVERLPDGRESRDIWFVSDRSLYNACGGIADLQRARVTVGGVLRAASDALARLAAARSHALSFASIAVIHDLAARSIREHRVHDTQLRVADVEGTGVYVIKRARDFATDASAGRIAGLDSVACVAVGALGTFRKRHVGYVAGLRIARILRAQVPIVHLKRSACQALPFGVASFYAVACISVRATRAFR
jgi:hypothetical protein